MLESQTRLSLDSWLGFVAELSLFFFGYLLSSLVPFALILVGASSDQTSDVFLQ
jgi:hypothetical protein